MEVCETTLEDDIVALRMGKRMVPETLENFNVVDGPRIFY
jgi:hypothetical protein